jgi:4-hydroxybenzoate polyprenyltransferase
MAVGGSAVAWAAGVVLGIDVPISIIVSLYFIIQPIYWFDRWLGFEEDKDENKERSSHMEKYFNYIPFICILYIAIAFALLGINQLWENFLWAVVFVILGGLYGLIFKKLTKHIFAFKNFFVALFFVLFGFYVMLPFDVSVTISLIAFSIFVFLRSIFIQAFFDAKDIASDKEEGYKTFPVVLGKDRIYGFLAMLNVLSILPVMALSFIRGGKLGFLLFLIPLIIAQFILARAKKKLKMEYFIILGLEYIQIGLLSLIINSVF